MATRAKKNQARTLTDAEEYVLMAAVRYQLPRMTYGSMIVGSAVRDAVPGLSAAGRAVIARDIREAITRGEVSRIDLPEWQLTLERLG